MDNGFDLDRATVSALDEIVEAGHYASREEVLREGVKLVQLREQKRAELLALLQEGIADCEAGRVHDIDDVERELLAELAAMERRHSA